ncbi:putative peptidoglycan hydrolase domain protein [Brevibacillus laterosporus GI-9]|nr:glucosaminidase domain-containing protein [Brevibacillus laterosporus]CCF17005.1 putative peptidoglycan hydrolase domain protein [Brevibacillus laterosporus GI-9]
MRKTKIPASLSIAQAILESAWGKSGLNEEINYSVSKVQVQQVSALCLLRRITTVNGQPLQLIFRACNNWGESQTNLKWH